MKVLLVGEYNRAHRNIKLGLETLGHKATVVGLTDGFKKVDVDIELHHYFQTGLLKKIRMLFLKLFSLDILGIHLKMQFRKHRAKLSGYDLVQFINEAPFACDRTTQKYLFEQLIKWNNNPFLLSCGTDYVSVKYAHDKKFRYSILTPYFKNKGVKQDYAPTLSYLTAEHQKLHQYLFKTLTGVISNDLDYHIPLIGNKKYLGMIPHAINTSLLFYEEPKIENKIIIFHGINTFNYYKKGNDIFDEALKIILSKYPEKIDVIVTKNLPYNEYLEVFNKAHILLDQVYAYDQGYNALEAMAKGKVVFTGAEQEWLEYYNVEEDSIVINALPDAEAIALKLEWLILNPQEIIKISKNARVFVEEEHDHIKMALRYLEKWQPS